MVFLRFIYIYDKITSDLKGQIFRNDQVEYMKKWCEKLKGNLFFVSQFALDDF